LRQAPPYFPQKAVCFSQEYRNSGEGTATPEELNARHIKGIKLLFLPSADLKRNLEGISFEVPADTSETPSA
jgi:hypothetical protein